MKIVSIREKPGVADAVGQARTPGRIARICRWTMTTTPFLLAVAAAIVTLSFVLSSVSGQWHWFQRSGALVVSLGAMLSTRRMLRACLGGLLDGCSYFNVAMPTRDAETKKDLRSAYWGFWTVGIGTLIWV